ncbi:adenylate kinase family protein [Vibrio mediterranei]
MMKLCLIGPPGSGKGTQALAISRQFNIPQISTGDLLRQECENASEQGLALADIMAKGELIDDAIVIDLLKRRLAHKDCHNGYILDGFPRTVSQAKALHQSGIVLDAVVVLNVTDEAIIDRLSGRRVHLASGRSYHVRYSPPVVEGVDDITGERLIQRPDDHPETVQRRLEVYRELTAPIIDFYQAPCFIQSLTVTIIDVEDWMQKFDVSDLLFASLRFCNHKVV